MSYGRRRTANLTDSGQISTAGIAAELLELVFTGVTAGDTITLTNGSGGSTITGPLTVPANGNVKLGPYDEGKGIVFNADIYASVAKTGNACVFVVYRELE